MSSKKKQYRSEAFAAIHETMNSLHQIGAINKKTMRDFDAACLETVMSGSPRSGFISQLPSHYPNQNQPEAPAKASKPRKRDGQPAE